MDVDDWELFDTAKDPHELRNVIALPEYAKVTTDLKQEILRLRKELKVPDRDPPSSGSLSGDPRGGSASRSLKTGLYAIEDVGFDP